MHKFKIIKNDKGFRVQFVFKSEVIFWTESYTKKASALKAINSLKEKALLAEIEEVDETSKAKAAAKALAKKTIVKKAVVKKTTTKVVKK